jgi:Domain of unknown function (DUF3883)
VSGYKDVKSRAAVLSAISECNRRGRENFREHYGFLASREYFLRYKGKEYDSKPIIAVAHKYQFPDLGPLSNTIAGGKKSAALHLARLGFSVDGVSKRASDWTLDEVEATSAAYFRLLGRQKIGKRNDNAPALQKLLVKLPERNLSAVSRKFSNISSILSDMALPYLRGFAPLANRQILLEAVVNDWLSDNPDLFSEATEPEIENSPNKPVNFEVPPPSKGEFRDAIQSRRATKTDFAERDQRNRNLGRKGEQWAVDHFKQMLMEQGKSSLAAKTEWISETQGDGLGYDIVTYTKNGKEVFVEVKTTNGSINSPFIITSNEIRASQELGKNYVLMRIFNFSDQVQYYILRGRLDKICSLQPTHFRAQPQ